MRDDYRIAKHARSVSWIADQFALGQLPPGFASRSEAARYMHAQTDAILRLCEDVVIDQLDQEVS